MTTPGGAGTLRRHCNFSRARRTGFSHKVGAFGLQGTAPLSQIETFGTFCGIVWLRAKVLGRMGWTTSPHLRAGALSCLSLALTGQGPTGLRPLYCPWPRPSDLSGAALCFRRVTARLLGRSIEVKLRRGL